MTVGDRIKQKRLEMCLSVDELADRLGKSKATIYRYESGDIGAIPFAQLQEVASALDTTVPALMGWDQTIKEPTPFPKPEPHKTAYNMIAEQLNSFSDDQLERISKYAQLLLEARQVLKEGDTE